MACSGLAGGMEEVHTKSNIKLQISNFKYQLTGTAGILLCHLGIGARLQSESDTCNLIFAVGNLQYLPRLEP
jgi:hypothetical protein